MRKWDIAVPLQFAPAQDQPLAGEPIRVHVAPALSRAAAVPLDYDRPPPQRAAPVERGQKAEDSAGFVTSSIILLACAVMAEIGGASAASWFFGDISLILLIVRLAMSAASR